jgi:hypothetical protein
LLNRKDEKNLPGHAKATFVPGFNNKMANKISAAKKRQNTPTFYLKLPG